MGVALCGGVCWVVVGAGEAGLSLCCIMAVESSHSAALQVGV